MKLKTINNRMKLVMAIALSLVILLNFSIPTLVIAMLLGLLFIPPVLLFASVFKEGAPLIAKELRTLLESGKEKFIISISRESIVLEPNVER